MFGSVLGAAMGLVLAPRRGEPRSVALRRLRLAMRPGHGSLRDFSGTPCSTAVPASAGTERGPAEL